MALQACEPEVTISTIDCPKPINGPLIVPKVSHSKTKSVAPAAQHPGSAIDFRPVLPKRYRPPIGLIGCGGISKYHLQAYLDADLHVVALCDLRRDLAEQQRTEFFTDADVYDDFTRLLDRDDIEVVDITTHPNDRVNIVRAALLANKHVLSQKPFVLDLDVGRRLCELANKQNRVLAVNQNARWAPHFCYARRAIEAGLIGTTFGAHMSVHWDHAWVKGTSFETVKHLILYDYAIHWFDILRCLLPSCTPKRVFASTARAKHQTIMPNLLGQALIEWDHGQSTLAFDAAATIGSQERTFVTGERGTITSVGPGNNEQVVTLENSEGLYVPKLTGKWFPDGFRGAMGELLCSIEENRRCQLDAQNNLESLAICFAAIASAESGESKRPFEIVRLPD